MESNLSDRGIPCKRPVNVDIVCHLRVIGQGRSSFIFTSDEGDGYEIYPGYPSGDGPDLKPHHFEEWSEQLQYAAAWCQKKAKELSTGGNVVG